MLIYGNQWKGTSGSSTRYFRPYANITFSETPALFTINILELGIQCVSGGNCTFESASKARITISGASGTVTGSPLEVARKSGTTVSFQTGTMNSYGNGVITVAKTSAAQDITITLYGDKTSGAAWNGSSTKSFALSEIASPIAANAYTVTFDANGGGAVNAVSKPYNTVITLPTTTRQGYELMYWTDGTNQYEAGGNYTITSDITLTARWHMSFIMPSISGLKAYRVDDDTSGYAPEVAEEGTKGYVEFTYTGPQQINEDVTPTMAITFAGVNAASIVQSNNTIYAYSSNSLSVSAQHTVTITVSGQKWNGEAFNYVNSTFISAEEVIWDAYQDDEGNKGFALGKPFDIAKASANGFFECAMNTDFTGTLTHNGQPIGGGIVPTNLSEFTDDLGSSPVHTHSQYENKRELLWSQNVASTDAGSKTLSKSITNFDIIQVVFVDSVSDLTYRIVEVPATVGAMGSVNGIWNLSNTSNIYFVRRSFTLAATSITFTTGQYKAGNAMTTAKTNAGYVIPVKVYGVKY